MCWIYKYKVCVTVIKVCTMWIIIVSENLDVITNHAVSLSLLHTHTHTHTHTHAHTHTCTVIIDIFQTGMTSIVNNIYNIYKGGESATWKPVNHCGWSDTLSSILPLVNTLLPSPSRPHTHTPSLCAAFILFLLSENGSNKTTASTPDWLLFLFTQYMLILTGKILEITS